MTVRAYDFALLDLGEDFDPITQQPIREAERLVSQMVELQHHYVIFSAVNARMVSEIVDEEADPLVFNAHPSVTSIRDVAIAMLGVMLLLVRRAARSAVVIAQAPIDVPPGEVIDRFLFPASAAPTEHFFTVRMGWDKKAPDRGPFPFV
jgi:hypothetical protein